MAAAVAAASFDVADALPPSSAPGDACSGLIPEDVWDIVIMSAVFAIGWFVVKKLAIDAGSFFRRRTTPKILPDDDVFKPSAQAVGSKPSAPLQMPLGKVAGLEFNPRSCSGYSVLEPCMFDNPSMFIDAKLCELASAGDLSACWLLLRSRSGGVSLSSDACATLVSTLRYTVDPADADSALDAAVASQGDSLAEAAIATGARLRDAAWLSSATARMQQAGLPMKASYFAELARAHGREGRGDLAVDLWCARCGGGADGDIVGSLEEPELYGAAFEACAASSDFTSAARMARASGWRAPVSGAGQVAMLALARWLARHQGVALARRCTAAVRSAGGLIDALTLRVMLASSVRSGDMMQAKEFFDELSKTGLSPGFEAYSSLIRGYCAAGNIEQALAQFHAMRQHGIAPEVQLFNAVLGTCASRNMLGLAEEMLADMESLGVQPTSSTMAALVRLHGARGQISRALDLFNEFPRRHGLEPDSCAYHALVSACLAGGRVDLALDVFAKMTSAGCIANARTYEALIASCIRRGDLAYAASLVEDALGLAPVDEVAQGTASEAAEVVLTLPQQPLPPQRRALVEPQVVEELLRLIGRRGEATRLGLPLLARLQEAGYEVSERVASGVRRAAAAPTVTPRSDGEATLHKTHTSMQAAREERRAEWARWRCGFKR